jgi:ribosomal protein S18 acetylase RimI-like enzyme
MIRFCREDDLEIICRIARDAWEKIFDGLESRLGKDLYSILNPDCRNSKERFLRAYFASHPDCIYVAERSGKVVGFIAIILDHDRKIGEITNNAVDPHCGEKGVGQEMYQAALARFRAEGMKVARVHTGLDEAHAPARRAYERAGFRLRDEQVMYVMDLSTSPSD